MEKKRAFGHLSQFTNFFNYREDINVVTKRDYYTQLVLSANDNSYLWKLKDLRKEVGHNDYMCILEHILNYIATIYNTTVKDYIDNNDYYIAGVVIRIKRRYNNVLRLYDLEFSEYEELIQQRIAKQLREENEYRNRKSYPKTKVMNRIY